MLFNSLQFAIFFIIVYALYLVLNHKWQNRMLLVASCIFYGAWNWRFLFLMFTSISVDYFCAISIGKSDDPRIRKRFLFLSVFVNLTILGFFKYFNFFADSLQIFINYFGFPVHLRFLNIILPIGISFYTFEAMSYVIDVYRKKMEPTRDYLDYALFVVYFPHLIAGPIMRARDLLPQITLPRRLDLGKFYEGCYLFCWGMFEKVFVADNLAKIVDPVFAGVGHYNGVMVLLALYAFSFQIFCDFAGYSNMARGLGKIMGFDIMVNFNLPYFATNPREFWQRWHISLSTWLRDYLYIPLGGNRKSTFITYCNLAITMFLGGLWHGAAWTFVVWGIYQGLLLIIHRAFTPFLAGIAPSRNAFIEKSWFIVRVIFFFHLICLGWLFFRAQSITQAFQMLHSLLFNFTFTRHLGLLSSLGGIFWAICFLLFIQIFQFAKKDLLVVFRWNWFLQGVTYFIILFFLATFGAGVGKEFIYFQF